ncbi:MAG: hypothetical protein CM15mP51_02110 [Porticoccaceae bacterium]|nr:MAG: hypothetical protein CM15mP51_02110 [Porticoccaceae bacterium]
MNIVLFEPEIPPNTGNIIRLVQTLTVDFISLNLWDLVSKKKDLEGWPRL